MMTLEQARAFAKSHREAALEWQRISRTTSFPGVQMECENQAEMELGYAERLEDIAKSLEPEKQQDPQ